MAWATTQNDLGVALTALGTREIEATRLEDAIAVHRASLQEYTREHTPLVWAMAQNNLGFALATLGERESDTARLQAANRCVPQSIGGANTRAYAAAVGQDAKQSCECPYRAWGSGWRSEAAGGGGDRISQSVDGAHGERVPLEWAETQRIWATPYGDSESGRKAQRGWRKRLQFFGAPWKN